MTENTSSGWWYLSFAGEDGWLGGCFVRATGIADAVTKAHEAQCNPGGEVACWGPLEVDIKPDFSYRLLTEDEVETARM